MTNDEARERIDAAITQYGAQAGMAIDLIISEVRSSLGREAANDLIEEFDLELTYNIPPQDTLSGDS